MPSTHTAPQTESSRVVLLLAAMVLLVPALGTNSQELLQDTLKSMLVAFFTLGAALHWVWHMRTQRTPVHVHPVLGWPLVLMLYALGSMLWSHAFLAGVEAIRWFIFGLILLLGMNTLTLRNMVYLAWSIHIGAVMAALWAALQFWFDFQFFPQGPNPGSTFVNRNFFAEFLVCTLPFSVLLLTRLKDKTSVFLISFSLAFNVTTLLMAGMRSALLAMLLILPILIAIVWRTRQQVVSTGWRALHVVALGLVMITTVAALGSLKTNNPDIIKVTGRTSAIERAVVRVARLGTMDEYTHQSFSVRAVMWKATVRMIAAHPWAGIGAGAWEVQDPLYQEADSPIETDYYPHNEFLQLAAEYGILGWLSLTCLLVYLAHAAYRTWTNHSPQAREEAPVRALALASLLALMVVSIAGFPWRLASTAALFALSLAVLAASDVRLQTGARHTFSFTWRPLFSKLGLALGVPCAALALYISAQAVTCESLLLRALISTATINASGKPDDPRWNGVKANILAWTREGIAINTHYRKLTPSIADALASWGDWRNAIWIWESVLVSRPNIVAIITNISRGYLALGNSTKAQEYVDKAHLLRPNDTSVKTVQVLIWSRTGHEQEAAQLSKELLGTRTVDHDLMQTAYVLGTRLKDTQLSILALEQGIKNWPDRAIDGWLRLGLIYATSDNKDEAKAIASFRAAMDLSPAQLKPGVLAQVPQEYKKYLQ